MLDQYIIECRVWVMAQIKFTLMQPTRYTHCTKGMTCPSYMQLTYI